MFKRRYEKLSYKSTLVGPRYLEEKIVQGYSLTYVVTSLIVATNEDLKINVSKNDIPQNPSKINNNNWILK